MEDYGQGLMTMTHDNTHKALFDLNTYYVPVIENPDPYGSPLCVLPWQDLPLNRVGFYTQLKYYLFCIDLHRKAQRSSEGTGGQVYL